MKLTLGTENSPFPETRTICVRGVRALMHEERRGVMQREMCAWYIHSLSSEIHRMNVRVLRCILLQSRVPRVSTLRTFPKDTDNLYLLQLRDAGTFTSNQFDACVPICCRKNSERRRMSPQESSRIINGFNC